MSDQRIAPGGAGGGDDPWKAIRAYLAACPSSYVVDDLTGEWASRPDLDAALAAERTQHQRFRHAVASALIVENEDGPVSDEAIITAAHETLAQLLDSNRQHAAQIVSITILERALKRVDKERSARGVATDAAMLAMEEAARAVISRVFPAHAAQIAEKDAILQNPQKWMKWCDVRVLERAEAAEAQLASLRDTLTAQEAENDEAWMKRVYPMHGYAPDDGLSYAEFCRMYRSRWEEDQASLVAKLTEIAADLRHAYAQIHGNRVSRRGMQQFADGFIAPQIRKLEALSAAPSTPSQEQP